MKGSSVKRNSASILLASYFVVSASSAMAVPVGTTQTAQTQNSKTNHVSQASHASPANSFLQSPQAAKAGKATPKTGSSAYNISGPFCSENLAVYLIRGPEKMKGQNILTLEEALKNKQVVIEETSNVNELKVKNLSDSVVFLQSGDIVRGGKQDRAIQYDMMLSPKASNSLPVFCVEHDRWQQRGAESSASFASSYNQLSGKDLKLAAKKQGDQSSVWNNVSKVQGKLCRSLGASAAASPSPSSLELTLENSNVKAASKSHLEKLGSICKGQNDVVGFAFAINGKVNSADVYASNQLFQKLYPKLLKSASAEAVAEAQKQSASQGRNPQIAVLPAPRPEAIQQFMTDAENKPAVRKSGDQSFEMTEQETSKSLLYKTKWYASPRKLNVADPRPSISDLRQAPDVHVNYINK